MTLVRVVLYLVLGSLLFSCGDNLPSQQSSIDDFLPNLSPTVGGKQEVFGGIISLENSNELISGPASSGGVGDYFLRNDRARFVIRAATPVVSVVMEGGNLVDVAPLAEDGSDLSPDHFGETAMMYQMGRQCLHTEMEIVRDGSEGGAAVLRARGDTGYNRYVNLRGVGILPLPTSVVPDVEDDAECATTYVLEPGSATLKTYLTIFNRSSAVISGPMSLLSDTGGEISIFAPGVGFSKPTDIGDIINSGGTVSPYLVWQGPNVSYGIFPRHDDISIPNSSVSLLGVSIFFFGLENFLESIQSDKNKFFSINEGEGFTFEVDVFVGRDASDVEAEFRRLSDTPVRELTGRVEYTDGGSVAAARIGVFHDHNRDGAIDDEDTIASFIQVRSDGSFSGRMPAGDYLLRAEIAGLARSNTAPVSISDGMPVSLIVDRPIAYDLRGAKLIGANSTDVSLVIDRPIAYDYRIVDDGNEDAIIPGRITVVGENPIKTDFRTSGNIDTYSGIVAVVAATRGTSVDLGDGADSQIILPAGNYRVFVSRGTEWSIAETVLRPIAGENPSEIEFRMRRLVDTREYIASEYHVHSLRSPDSLVSNERRVATAVADGIEFYATTEHDYISEHQSIIERLGLSRLVRCVSGSEISPMVYGHFNVWPLQRDQNSPTGGAVDWPLGEGGFAMTPAQIFSAARQKGAELVQVSHPRQGPGESAGSTEHFDRIALTFDYENRRIEGDQSKIPVPLDWLRLPPETPLFSSDFNALEVWNGFGVKDTNGDGVREISKLDIVMRDWFNFLSFGKTLAPLANSDTHYEVREAMGMPRTLVRVGDDGPGAISSGTELTREIMDTLTGALGKPIDVLLTDGPHISVTVDDEERPLGRVLDGSDGAIEISVVVHSPDWAQIDTIEVFSNSTPEVGAVNVSALEPFACFTTRTELSAVDPCEIARLGGAGTLEVEKVELGGGFQRYESAIRFTVEPSQIPSRDGATGQDAWFVVRARGTRPIYPLFIGNLFDSVDVSTFVEGSSADVEDALRGLGRPATALTSAFYVDFDGGGYIAPFAPRSGLRDNQLIRQTPLAVP